MTLWFARHIDPEVLGGLLETTRQDHQQRLSLYRDVEGSLATDDDRLPVIRFGIAYEQSILDWLDETASRHVSRLGG